MDAEDPAAAAGSLRRERDQMTETMDRATRERRLKVRCWRRGTKEMDLILGGFFDEEGARLSDADLSAFEALIGEEDDSLYRWISGAAAPPAVHADIIDRLRRRAGAG